MTVQAKQAEKKFRQMDQRQPGDFEATEDMSNGMRLTKSSDWRAGAKIYLIPTLLAAWVSCVYPPLALELTSLQPRRTWSVETWAALTRANANRPNAGRTGDAAQRSSKCSNNAFRCRGAGMGNNTKFARWMEAVGNPGGFFGFFPFLAFAYSWLLQPESIARRSFPLPS